MPIVVLKNIDFLSGRGGGGTDYSFFFLGDSVLERKNVFGAYLGWLLYSWDVCRMVIDL